MKLLMKGRKNMNDKSIDNIKTVLKEVCQKDDLKFEFLEKLLETELLTDVTDEDKIKTLEKLIDMEVENV